MNYHEFLSTKERLPSFSGVSVECEDIHSKLFDFQKAIVKWACRKGRAAIFATTGMGKTFMQLEWARIMGETSLIVAPLCVAKQTIHEAGKIGISVRFVRRQEDILPGLNITNYEMLEHFTGNVDAVVLDESSILKSLSGKTKRKLIDIFRDTKFKLCCTATPAPNDFTELGNHAEFLGIMKHVEMLATYFVNDPKFPAKWRMKGHAKEAFYRWLASWAVAINNPSDLGFDGSRFVLPPLNINPVIIESGIKRDGELFFTGLHGIQDRSAIRKATVDERITAVADMVRNSNDSQWICWCGLNDEANKLTRELNGVAVNVQGSDSIESKEAAIEGFLDGSIKVLVTKPKIAGFGMNFQNAKNMAFVGLSDSYEQYFQCIRRAWRYGQDSPVNVHVILTDAERDIYRNILRKEADANTMSEELVKNIEEFERIEVLKKEVRSTAGNIVRHDGKDWTLYNGDCVETLATMPKESIDFSVYSPPFIALYTYTADVRDMGNSMGEEEFFKQYSYFVKELLRVTKPGRNTACHVSQVPAMLVRDGYIGMKDFRGMAVKCYQDAGWVYHGEIVIQKNPQSQAVRTKSKSLMFVQLRRDSSWLRPGLADYILLFRKPGDNAVPIRPDDISNDDWITWAHPVWFDIRENNTLNKCEARTENDERHICPLQLDVIDRCIRLWSNRGEAVLSPFAGIGSEGYQAIRNGRRFVGIELKPEYADVAIRNLRRAENECGEQSLLAMMEA